MWPGEAGGRPRSVRAAGLARGACERGHGPGGDDDLPDGVVLRVRDVQVAGPVSRDAAWRTEICVGAGPVRAGDLVRPAREGGHGAGRDDDLPDDAVLGVGDVEVARSVRGDVARAVEAVPQARPRVQDGTRRARERVDGAGRNRDFPDRAVVGDVKVARPVGGDVAWAVEAGGGAHAIRAAVLARRAGEGGDDAGRDDDLADALVVGVGDLEVAGAVGGDAARPAEARRGAGAVGAADFPPCRERRHDAGRKTIWRMVWLCLSAT